MSPKLDPMFAVFANHNTKNDMHVRSNRRYYPTRKPITTKFEIIEAIETPTIKKIETE